MCAGNVIGPLLYSTNEAPLYRTGLIANLVMFVTVGVVSAYVPPLFPRRPCVSRGFSS